MARTSVGKRSAQAVGTGLVEAATSTAKMISTVITDVTDGDFTIHQYPGYSTIRNRPSDTSISRRAPIRSPRMPNAGTERTRNSIATSSTVNGSPIGRPRVWTA